MEHGVEGFARLDDAKGHLRKLAHHGTDDQFGRFAMGGQALLEALTPRGLVQGHHGRHVQRTAQEGMADLGQTRLAADAAAGFVQARAQTGKGDELARRLEPRAPRPDLRLEAVRQLNLAGVPAGVICAPVLPGITDAPADLEALVATAAQAGAKYIFANPLFLKPCSASIFLPFLEQEFPHLVANYRERYQSRAFLPPAYGKRLSQLMEKLREKYGIRNDYDRYSRRAHPGPELFLNDQMALFPKSA